MDRQNVVPLRIASDLAARRVIALELPEFLVRALENRVVEANADTSCDDPVTLNDYIEYELAKLISISEVAEMEIVHPGFADAVQAWVASMREQAN